MKTHRSRDKKGSDFVKKALVCLLAILMLTPLTASADGFFGVLFGSPSSGLALRYVPVANEAFFTLDGNQEARLLGASGDGNMLLFFNLYELYLWDQSAQARVPITFARPEDAETMTQLAPTNAVSLTGRGLKPEQRQEKLDQLREAQTQYLAQRNLTAFANMDQISERFPHLVELKAECAGISDHWALVSCGSFPCAAESRVGLQHCRKRSGHALFMPSPTMRRGDELTIVHGYFVLEGK